MIQRIAESLFVVILAALLSLIFFGEIAKQANDIFFSGVGDGIKNYYVVFFPVLHGGPVFLSSGLGYPFPEHLMYLDAQPLMVWFLRLVSWAVPADYWLPGLFNGLILLSPIASSLALYGIFRNLGHPRTLSVAAGCGIAFLSPQLLRMLGHYALSYGVAIPLCWLLLIWSRKHPSLRNSLLVAGNTLFWSLVHVYYLALLSVLVGISWVLRLSRRPASEARWGTNEGERWKFLHASLQFFLPVLAVGLLVLATDPYSQIRPQATADLDPTRYRSTPTAMLLPWAEPLGQGLEVAIRNLGDLSEGMVYLGLSVPVILLVLMLTRLAGWLGAFRHAPSLSSALHLSPDEILQKEVLLEALWVGLAGLFLALGWLWNPYLEGLGEWLGPLRQFRAIGRFAWLFYYTISVFAFSKLYLLGSRGTRPSARNLVTLLLAVCLSVQFFEAWGQASEITRTLRVAAVSAGQVLAGRQNSMSGPTLPPGVQARVYQAILPIPYYHIGSDVDFRYLGRGISVPVSMALSLRTGLPLLSMQGARTPLSLTRQSLSLLDKGPDLASFRRHFPNRKPFLIVLSDPALTAAEQALLDRSRPLGSWGQIRFFEISFENALSD